MRSEFVCSMIRGLGANIDTSSLAPSSPWHQEEKLASSMVQVYESIRSKCSVEMIISSLSLYTTRVNAMEALGGVLQGWAYEARRVFRDKTLEEKDLHMLLFQEILEPVAVIESSM